MHALWNKLFQGRLTIAGAAFSLAVLLVGLAAFASANNLLFLLLAALLSTLLVSGFISRLGLAGLELDLQLPQHITARRKAPARLLLHNSKSWMPSFSIRLSGLPGSPFASEIYVPVLAGGATINEPADLVFMRRGIHKENSFQISTRFPFGFTERHVRVTLRHEVTIYPAVDPQPGFAELLHQITGEMEARQRGQGSDFYRIRPYESTESARHVDWKATAHVGSLQVREYAREQEQVLCLVLDLNTPLAHLPFFERSVDCCAYLAWMMWLKGARLRFVSEGVDLRVPEEADVYAVLQYLALVQPKGGSRLPEVDHRSGHCVVFSATAGAELAGPHARLVTPADLG